MYVFTTSASYETSSSVSTKTANVERVSDYDRPLPPISAVRVILFFSLSAWGLVTMAAWLLF